MPNVQMPDGNVVQFPDGMSESDINQALSGWGPDKDMAPTPAAAPPTGLNRLGQMVGEDLATGAENLLGLPGTVANALNLTPPKGWGKPMSGSDIAKATGLGRSQRPDLVSQGWENYLDAGVEALPTAAIIALTGGGALPALALTEPSAMMAEYVHQKWPDSKWGPVAAGLVTSLGAQGIVSKLAEASANSAALERFNESDRALESARSAKALALSPKNGAPATAAAIKDASQENLASTVQSANADVAAAGQQSQQEIESTAASLGKATDLQEAGANAQPKARNWFSNIYPAKMKAVTDPLDIAFPKTAPADATNYQTAIDAMTSNAEAGSLKGQADLLSPNLAKQLKDELDSSGDMQDLTGGPAPSLTAGNLRAVRTKLGQAMADPTLIKGASQSQIATLYRAISQDLGASAAKVGPDASKAWSAFNNESTRLHEFAAGPLSKLITTVNKGKETIDPEVAANNFLPQAKIGGTELQSIRDEIPGAVDELAAGYIRQGHWGDLSEKAKAALIPDPTKRAALEQAIQLPARAQATAQSVIERATQDHAATSEAADLDLKDGNWTRTEAVRQAVAARKAAKAALPPEAPPGSAGPVLEKWMHKLGPLVSGGSAFAGAPHILNALGVESSTPLNIGLGLTAGAAPYIFRGAKSLVQHPRNVLVPVSGAVAGQNTLVPGSTP